jgi:hypothetical protein
MCCKHMHMYALYLTHDLCAFQNMRSKREESRVVKVSSADGGVEKKKPSGTKLPGRRNQENGGEVLVRYITTQGESDNGTVNGSMKNPFLDNKWEKSPDISMETTDTGMANSNDFTKFHLEDDEMLLELMIHLHADCPDLMHDKTDLIDRVSKLYDKLHSTNPT